MDMGLNIQCWANGNRLYVTVWKLMTIDKIICVKKIWFSVMISQ
ncbi:MAG: hypothetical protein Hyperionvirus3_59 [Hyperionvirus sp.]|uniref:Uncharacterized protein n=1 Tax=Hyperionvirus sp. TaxID=2487770 RepID=A0A3G5AAR7_9VIRU|nr:MAG: hypothetical protein Hyperionvirus3_59 [Hyperionvirus sp.]